MAETGSVTVRVDEDYIKERVRAYLVQAWNEGWDHAWKHARDECNLPGCRDKDFHDFYAGIPNPYDRD